MSERYDDSNLRLTVTIAAMFIVIGLYGVVKAIDRATKACKAVPAEVAPR